MVGSSNKAANGNLDNLAGELSIFAGPGYDRLFVNDQSFDKNQAGYRITENLIQDSGATPTGNPVFLSVISVPARFAPIQWNGGLELVRVNGSSTQPNEFRVSPSTVTKIIVSGSNSSNDSTLRDRLFIEDYLDVRRLSNSNGNGAWTFAGQAQDVHFHGIEIVDNEAIESFDGGQ